MADSGSSFDHSESGAKEVTSEAQPRAVKIAVSVGCPCGIGPEVAVLAATQIPPARGTIALVGDTGAIADAAALRGVDLSAHAHVTVVSTSHLPPEQRRPGEPGPEAGRAQLAAIDGALGMVLAGDAVALVTGPVSKQAIASAGVPFVGHTEYLRMRTGSGPVVMFFVGPRLRTSLVTTHLALADVPRAVTREAVARTIALTARSLQRDFGIEHPRLVVAGLNPHAGEGGMFGSEEQKSIAPGIADAAALLGDSAEVVGPVSAEAAYRQARDGQWDAVIAMYHDQATIASKLLDFGDAVNITLGLPIVRTSVDHGTGYDIAGRGVADPRGMRAAMEMAFAIASRR